MDQTGGEGVDLVVEVGGTGTLGRSMRAARIGGTMAQVGALSGLRSRFRFLLLHKTLHVRGIYVGSRKDFVEMSRAITLAQLRPVGEEFHWSQVREVLFRMEGASHFGKLVVTVG